MNAKLTAKKWLKKATNDILWSRASLKDKIYYGSCFVSQQATEKSLKAFIYSEGLKSPKIHDLNALLKKCIEIDSEFKDLKEDIKPLTDYYIQTRYPDIGDFIDYTEKKAKDALQTAEKIVNFVRTKISNEN